MKRISYAMSMTFIFCTSATIMAQEPTARERELEKLVYKLIDKVEKLEGRVHELEGDSNAPGTNQQRLKNIEQSVEELKQERPNAADAETWIKIKKIVNNELSMRPYWKDGLRFESMDKSVSLKVGGRIQNDWAYFVEETSLEDRLGDFEDRVEFRRARFYVSGTIANNTFFKAQYDFAGGDADFRDVYMGLKNVPVVGNIRVGQFKEPFGMDKLTSSNHTTFMERSLPDVFSPGRNVGMMIHNTSEDKLMTWAVGLFRQTNDFGTNVGGRDYNVTGRVTWLPMYEDKGKKLLHVGAAYTHQNYEDSMIRFRQRPESHLAPRLVDTGNFSADSASIIGAELAYVDGPFSFQGEYVKAFIQSRGPFLSDPTFSGAYVLVSYFLTGEHRPYKQSSGVFGNVKPLHNYDNEGGKGAWEIAGRFSYLNLTDGNVTGGRQRDLTLGLNWYLNPNVKTSWNYVLADPADGGDVSIFQWRFQVAF